MLDYISTSLDFEKSKKINSKKTDYNSMKSSLNDMYE